MNTKYIIVVSIFLLQFLMGCAPPAYSVRIKNLPAEREQWFGDGMKLPERLVSWKKLQSLSGANIYFEKFDTSLLETRVESPEFNHRTIDILRRAWPSSFDRASKTFKVINDKESADYLAYGKFISVTQHRGWEKVIPSPAGFATDQCGMWFKIVNKKTSKVIFAYDSSGISVGSLEQFDEGLRAVCSIIDNSKIEEGE